MGLRNVVKNAAKTAVEAVGDLATTTTYHSHISTSYSVVGGTTVSNFTSISGVMVIFDKFTMMERFVERVSDATDKEEKKIYIPALNISGITPDLKDKVVTDSGEVWEVMSVETDPAKALWTLKGRRAE